SAGKVANYAGIGNLASTGSNNVATFANYLYFASGYTSWDQITNDWIAGNGGPLVQWANGEDAYFPGNQQTVNVVANFAPQPAELVFPSGATTISGAQTSEISLSVTANTTINVATNITATINAVIGGGSASYTLTDTGGGTLIVTGNNKSLADSITVTGSISAASILKIESDGALGTGNVSVSSYAALQLSGGI